MFDSVISGCFAYHLGFKIYSLSPACPDFAAYENRVWEAQGRSAALNHPYTRLSFQPFQFCGCRQSCWSSQSTRLTLRGSSSTLTRASAKSSTTLRTKIPWTGFPRFYVFMLILGWFGVKGLQVNANWRVNIMCGFKQESLRWQRCQQINSGGLDRSQVFCLYIWFTAVSPQSAKQVSLTCIFAQLLLRELGRSDLRPVWRLHGEAGAGGGEGQTRPEDQRHRQDQL